jgi:hypothetical protein
MSTRTMARAVAAAASVVLLTASAAAAHDINRLQDDGAVNSGKETHAHDQHGGIDGHLPATSHNVNVIGKIDLFTEAEQEGRVADVSAKGNYAYLAMFREPSCDRGGIQVVDISNPASPKAAGLIPSHLGTYAGEGSQVIAVDTSFFKGDLLVYQNEICAGNDKGVGGVTLVDVTKPLQPKKLVEGFGDFSVNGKSQTHSNQVHSAFAWQDGSKAYVVLVDDEEATDVDILDITNPSRPKLISETDLTALTSQPLGAVHGDSVFFHDVIVKRINGVQTMLVSYWDGGYVKLNVNDPAQPVFIADTDYAAFDPVRLQYGQQISPEGNGHQSEFTRDNRFFIATDEDFNPYRVTATMENGTEFTAIQGSDVPQIDADTTLSGDTRAVGLACDAGSIPAPAGNTIAVVERGVCDFTVKVQLVEAAGYEGAIVFNRTGEDGCETLISMLVEAGIPAVFVSRTDGFRILTGSVPAGYTCSEDGKRYLGARRGHERTDGRDRRRVRRLGLRAPVRREHDAGPGPVRAARGPGCGICVRVRRPLDPRGRNRSGSGHRLPVALRRRFPRGELRQRRADGGRSLHRRGRKQLLGRRGAQAPERPEVRARERPRLGPLHLPVHRPLEINERVRASASRWP